MNEFEAAFFHGDYSVLSELASKLLYENSEDADTPEKIQS
jgi:hypothetical protein